MHRFLKNKSVRNYNPKPISDEKKVELFAEFLIEFVAIYCVIGGYAIYDFT